MNVQLCYSVEGKTPVLLELDIPQGSTIRELLSSLDSVLPPNLGRELSDLLSNHAAIAIFGKKKNGDFILSPSDRVEICRPLIAGPMDARRHRAKREHKSGKM